MRNLLASLALALACLVAPAALAQPGNSFPMASTPYNGSEVLIGYQDRATKNFPLSAIDAQELVSGTPVASHCAYWVSGPLLADNGAACVSLSTAQSWTATQTFPAATTSAPSIIIPAGTAPTSPTNGSLWGTASGLAYRAAGVTQQIAVVAQSLQDANNLGDLANDAMARTNLGVTATGADTAYAYRSDNLSDLSSPTTGCANIKCAPHVATEAALAAIATTAYPGGVWRDDYASGNGAPPLFYQPSSSACSLNSGAGDGGSQVPSSNSKCWTARFVGLPDIREWGAKPDNSTDNGPFFEAAGNANVGPVGVPPNVGCFLVASAVTWNSGTLPNFVGGGWSEYNGNVGANVCSDASPPQGSWIRDAYSGGNAFTLTSGAPLNGNAGFDSLAFTENQTSPAAAATATDATLSSTTLTIGGTVTGTIADGDFVVGAGALAATNYCTVVSGSGTSWTLSCSGTVSSGETVSFYAPWTPASIPAVIRINGTAGQVSLPNVFWYAVTNAINATGTAGVNGRLYAPDNKGQVFGAFLLMDHFGDSSKVSAHLWPYWSSNANVLAYTDANSIGIHTENLAGLNVPYFFENSGYAPLLIDSSANGNTTLVQIGNFDADSSEYGVVFCGASSGACNGAVTAANVQIANYIHSGADLTGSAGIVIQSGASGNTVQIGRMQENTDGQSAVETAGSGDTIIIGSALVENFNHDNGSYAAFAPGSTSNSSEILRIGAQPQIAGSNNSGATLGSACVQALGAGATCEVTGVKLSWTPALAATTTIGTVTYAADVGWAYRDGNKVTAGFFMTLSAYSGYAGNLYISGLPALSQNVTSQDGECTVVASNWTAASGYTALQAVVAPNTSNINLKDTGSGKAIEPAVYTEFTTDTQIEGVCTYSAASGL